MQIHTSTLDIYYYYLNLMKYDFTKYPEHEVFVYFFKPAGCMFDTPKSTVDDIHNYPCFYKCKPL